ncbi:MAG: anthranilate synthase component I family protein [Candidatus Eremiobacteraeota bacterium]|nr:anthranilate synthase component I family protein [Candidatus Eremiobacteraeota bacterium]
MVRTRTLSADVLTPIAAYAALATPGASCLLESVESGGRISRYSFVGIDYIESRSFEAGPGLLDAIREFTRAYGGAEEAPLGGALVAFSYDAARTFARLPDRMADAPAMPAAYVAIPGTWLVFDHFSDCLTIWMIGDDGPVLERRLDACIDRLLNVRPKLAAAFSGTGPVSQSLSRDRYVELVKQVKDRIYEGDVYQLQLGIRFGARLVGAGFDFYRTLRSRNPSPYMFYVDAPFGEVFGASPEFLVRLEGRQARIRPLAGTRARGSTENEDAAIAAELLTNEKERAEHVMLVDLGRNDLGSVCEYGSVRVTELLAIERYSHVMHIVSDLTGTLRAQHDALDLFAAGFPAGTVTGTPKVRAMQIVDRLEPVSRGFYAGSIGRWAGTGDFDSCITLRSVHVRDGMAYWQASAGIVADSDAQFEYDEILHKTRVIREALGVDA